MEEQLGSLRRCMDDAGVLVADGKELYDSNWMAKRAAKNIVTEFAGTANRLPTISRKHIRQFLGRGFVD